MATIVNPFRVAFMPDPRLVSNEEFQGHQRVPSDPWEGFATAEEAHTRASALGGWWVVVEIREVHKQTPEQMDFLLRQKDLEQARSDSSRLGDAHHLCRFCTHSLGSHNRIEGCMNCKCAATSGEARPR